MYEKIKLLLDKRGLSAYQVSKATGIAQSSFSDWKKKGLNPSTEKLKKLADYFQIPVDYFFEETQYLDCGMSDGLHIEAKAPELTKKDEKDIAKSLNDIIEGIDSKSAIMFNEEQMDEESLEAMKASLEQSMQLGKLLAKQKFTPKKYRK